MGKLTSVRENDSVEIGVSDPDVKKMRPGTSQFGTLILEAAL